MSGINRESKKERAREEDHEDDENK